MRWLLLRGWAVLRAIRWPETARIGDDRSSPLVVDQLLSLPWDRLALEGFNFFWSSKLLRCLNGWVTQKFDGWQILGDPLEVLEKVIHEGLCSWMIDLW
jgi:hypothetical protein